MTDFHFWLIYPLHNDEHLIVWRIHQLSENTPVQRRKLLVKQFHEFHFK